MKSNRWWCQFDSGKYNESCRENLRSVFITTKGNRSFVFADETGIKCNGKKKRKQYTKYKNWYLIFQVTTPWNKRHAVAVPNEMNKFLLLITAPHPFPTVELVSPTQIYGGAAIFYLNELLPRYMKMDTSFLPISLIEYRSIWFACSFDMFWCSF